MVDKIKLLGKSHVKQDDAQPFLDAAALHRAPLVLNSLKPGMHKLLPPCAPSRKANHGD